MPIKKTCKLLVVICWQTDNYRVTSDMKFRMKPSNAPSFIAHTWWCCSVTSRLDVGHLIVVMLMTIWNSSWLWRGLVLLLSSAFSPMHCLTSSLEFSASCQNHPCKFLPTQQQAFFFFFESLMGSGSQLSAPGREMQWTMWLFFSEPTSFSVHLPFSLPGAHTLDGLLCLGV